MEGNMEWYRAFYWAARYGSLSKAAEELYLSQPAVSHAIKQLEGKLGGPLFVRIPKGVKLTSEGEALFRYVEQAYHFLTMGEQTIAEMRQLLRGEIKIGAGDTLCKHVLLPRLAAFHRDYPDVQIQVTNRTSRETVRLLKEGKLDLGIVSLPMEEDRQLEFRPSLPLQDGFVASPAYAPPQGRPLELDELLRQPLLLLERGSSIRRYLDEFAHSQGRELKPEIELGSIDLLVQFAAAGFGIACVVIDFVRDELAGGSLIEVKLRKPVPPRHVGIVHLRDLPLSAAARRFIELLPQAEA